MTRGRRALLELLKRTTREQISRDTRGRLSAQAIGLLASGETEDPRISTLATLEKATGIEIRWWAEAERKNSFADTCDDKSRSKSA